MADPTTKTFTQLVQDQAAAVQSRAAGLVDFSVGSILRATSEAIAAVALWLQGMILTVLATTRASTSTGSDLDSWVADFGGAPSAQDTAIFYRSPASVALGNVTFGRYTTTGQSIIPVGATVSTSDGGQKFTVNLDTTNAAYRSSLGGYLMDVGVSSLILGVTAVTAGAAGNAVAGAVNTIASAIPGVDTVTNAAVFVSGRDAESDASLRARFPGYLQSLRRATPASLKYVIASLQPGAAGYLVENELYNGTPQRGFIYMIVDDGTGYPSGTLLTAANLAMDANRAAGVQFAVYAPSVVTVNVAMTLIVTSGAVPATVSATVQAALTAFINSLPLGQPLYLSRIYQVAHDAAASLAEITAVTLNGSAADVAITKQQVAKAGTFTISAS